MSYNGIGLPSAKGSSTSAYVQQSLAFNAKRQNTKAEPKKADTHEQRTFVQDESIILHKARREIEVLVSEYRDTLEDDPAEFSDDTIEKKCEEYRNSLLTHKG